MQTFIMFFIVLNIMCSCTLAINQIHTEGTASDVVDEVSKNDNEVETDIGVKPSFLGLF